MDVIEKLITQKIEPYLRGKPIPDHLKNSKLIFFMNKDIMNWRNFTLNANFGSLTTYEDIVEYIKFIRDAPEMPRNIISSINFICTVLLCTIVQNFDEEVILSLERFLVINANIIRISGFNTRDIDSFRYLLRLFKLIYIKNYDSQFSIPVFPTREEFENTRPPKFKESREQMTFNDTFNNIETGVDCTLCIEQITKEDLEKGNVVQMINCGHLFHRNCVFNEFNIPNLKNPKCPNCKTLNFGLY